jgi:hypothetical protein
MCKLITLNLVFVIGLIGCATNGVANRCLTYTVSGDHVDWSPTKFYQSKESENLLYIEIPKTIKYLPTIEVVDTEFDQPYKIDYSFDKTTHRFKVADNHDEYLMYREDPDGLEKNKIYITCNRRVFN